MGVLALPPPDHPHIQSIAKSCLFLWSRFCPQPTQSAPCSDGHPLTRAFSPELSHQSLLSSLAWTRHQPLSNPSSRKLPKRSFKTAPLSVSHPVNGPPGPEDGTEASRSSKVWPHLPLPAGLLLHPVSFIQHHQGNILPPSVPLLALCPLPEMPFLPSPASLPFTWKTNTHPERHKGRWFGRWFLFALTSHDSNAEKAF